MKIKEGKLHNFAYDLYVTSNARIAQKETGIDFEEAKKMIRESLPQQSFECVGGSNHTLIEATG